jgi:DNA-binding NtrC family response regulator
MSHSGSILIADDDKFIRANLTDLLQAETTDLYYAATAKETWQRLSEQKVDLVVLDIGFPDCSDLSLLKRIRETYPDIAVIVLTSQIDNVSQIVTAIKLGASDYVAKPFIPEELKNRVEKALSIKRLASAREYLLKELEERAGLKLIVGKSAAIQHVLQAINRLATVDGCVLIKGESGTGKELVARGLHYLSKRREFPFITVNCGAIPEALTESVLFGHKRGSFTGAVDTTVGRFEAAEEGSIFLDEIGEMPLAQQVSLLRVLEYRTFTPIGDTKERQCKARFIFATNRDIREQVGAGAFREDLFYRINVASILMPSLRSRNEDIPQLTEHYLTRLCAELGRQAIMVHDDVITFFKRYEWPGNVREFRNVLEGALMLMPPSKTELTMQDLPSDLLDGTDERTDATLTHLESAERDEILNMLKRCNWAPTQAAKMLGMHRNTITRKIRYYKISKS